MAMRHRGPRVQMTVRLPIDEYREVAVRARGRGWSMSDYVGWCVVNQLKPDRTDRRKNPLGHQAHPTPGRAGTRTGVNSNTALSLEADPSQDD